MPKIFVCLFIVVFFNPAFSQVSNNQIDQRFQLVLDDQPTHSTTANSSVEWGCVNKALTSKCLVYHNDQWFSFKVDAPGTYYLNISSQQCQKWQGLQVIVIEGNPCETETYSLIHCVPKVSQDDTFVELSSIKSNTLYLLNIDGFLGDFCEFDIRLSSRPAGLPVRFAFSDSVKVKSYVSERQVYLTWTASDELLNSIETFRVGRKKNTEVKSKWTEVALKANAYGKFITDYSLTDTLPEQGTYTYMILGLKKESGYPVFLHEQRISFWEKTRLSLQQAYVYITPDFEKEAPLEILVLNAYTDEVLKKSSQDYNPKKDTNIGIYVTPFIGQGIKNFVVRIKNTKTKEFRRFYFRLDEQGHFTAYTKGN